MAKAADQFRASDVTIWGIITLAVWAVAVLGANVSALIPSSIYGALHASRLDGSTVNQLRIQVSSLEEEAARMRRENSQLLQRFAMTEEDARKVIQRVGALEVSVPKVIEAAAAPASAPIPVDATTTGGIAKPKTLTFETEGGSVAVQQVPLDAAGGDIRFQVIPSASSLPAPVAPAEDALGVAIGFPVLPGDAEAQWQEMQAQAGTLLGDLSPLLGASEGTSGPRLIAGPVVDKSAAVALCDKLGEVGYPCEPVPFAGEAVPLLN